MQSTDIKGQKLEPIFPTPLWLYELQPAKVDEFNRILEPAVLRITQGKPGQTRQDLHLDPEFAPLVDFIHYGATQALASMHMDHYDFEITALWANVHYPGMHHQPHVHPNNYLGGTYYLKVMEGSDHITFADPRGVSTFVRPQPSELNSLNRFKVSYQMRPGTLAMFPAWLSHEVPENTSNDTRITLSFNIMFTDFNQIARPQWDPTI